MSVKLVEIGESNLKIADGNYSAKYPRSEEFVSEGIPFIRANNFDNKSIVDDELYYIKPEKHAELKKGHLKPRDVLITTRGNIGKVAIVPARHDDSNINAQIVLLRCNEGWHPEFLLYSLTSDFVKRQIPSLTTGTALKQLSVRNLKKLKIPLPPLETQKKIASILDAADAYRQKTKALIKKYDELTQSLFLEMFGEYLMGDLVPLGDLVNFSQGQQFGVELQSLEPQEGYARFLRIVDFTQGDDLRFVPNKSKKYYVRKDDIVIVRYGASAGFVGTNKEGVLANNLFKVNYDREQFNQLFLFMLFKHGRFKSFIKREAFGAAMPALSFKVMARFEVPTPSLDLQNQFAERVQKIEKQKAQAQESLGKAEELFSSLLQRAFKGGIS
ncbi:MAG: restriction endonuclease subunit S [Bacteroidota bacterium]